MTDRDPARMQTGFAEGMGRGKPEGYFARCLERQRAAEIEVLLAEEGTLYVGHVLVCWHSEYRPFRERGIPELQDLNVARSHRRRGIATRLLDAAERAVAARSDRVGIGVGLHAAYGGAQRLYVLRGYVPDGLGAAYDGRALGEGERVRVDDALALYLLRTL